MRVTPIVASRIPSSELEPVFPHLKSPLPVYEPAHPCFEPVVNASRT